MAKIDKIRKRHKLHNVCYKKTVKRKKAIRQKYRRPPHTPPKEETDKDKQEEARTY